MKKYIMNVGVMLLAVLAGLACASDFAAVVVSSRGPFGTLPYNDPNAVLGEPTTEMIGDLGKTFKASLVYGAWNVTPKGQPTVLTLFPQSEVIIGFDHKVTDDTNNPYGIDMIVFSNAFFKYQSDEFLIPTSDMEAVYVSASSMPLYEEWVTVSVAQDPNGPWFSFSNGPAAGSLFPTNPYTWDSVNKQWGGPLDFLKPVNPDLMMTDFAGLPVSQAITLYDGSAGGTGFDLQWLSPADYAALMPDPITGRKWIQYVKLTSDEHGEVDALSDVAACGDYQHPFPAGDINLDCRVNLTDLAVLAENWLVCTWNCGV